MAAPAGSLTGTQNTTAQPFTVPNLDPSRAVSVVGCAREGHFTRGLHTSEKGKKEHHMNSAEEQMLKHTSDLFDRVLGPAREGNMTQSFDAIHNAALEPQEVSEAPCEPGKHVLDTSEVAIYEGNIIHIGCENYVYTAAVTVGKEDWSY